jgi:prepilin-type N-terminal cleavage/methylation domain-containing protein
MLTKLHSRLLSRNEAGFTLVELVIAVVIIGVLTAFSVPAYTKMQEKARFVTVQTQLRSTVELVEAYRAKYGEYPKTQLWSYQGSDPNGSNRNSYIPGLVPEYIQELPIAPNKDGQFVYNSNGKDYKIIRYNGEGFSDSEWAQIPESMKDNWGAANKDRYGYWSPGFAGV